ncbi:MAG: YfcC family protein [Ruminococcaceae bacterium]|nr:YfcC family protein [Oscillospiraceae bacterium]
MSNEKVNNTENKGLGISLDKKTVIAIISALVIIMAFVGVLTQVLPRGEYQVIEKDGYEQIVNGTYKELNDYKMPVWKIFLAPVLCFTSSYAGTGILIIVMVILIGGAFLILDKCGVMKFMMATLIKKFSKRKYSLMAVIIFCGMALSSVAGVLEESVTLVPIAVAVSLALGWDSLVGLGLSLVSIAWGFTAATFNPFNVATVQKLAGLEVFSGLSLRFVVFLGVYLILFAFLFLYAKKIEKNPKKSLVYESDKALREKYKIEDIDLILNNTDTKKGAKAFLICMAIDILAIIIDFALDLGGGLSLPAMAILFTVGGVLAGYFTGLKGKSLFKSFLQGAKTIAPVIPVVIFVIAISYILAEAKIMHTILFNVYNLLQGLSPYVAIVLLFVLIAFLEFFIGSGTAKAFLIMPLIAPLSDLVGITRQSIVTTFCLADGFTNLLYPTSGIMIIAIGLVGVSYGKWLKWSWKLFVGEFIFSVLMMLLMVGINYN